MRPDARPSGPELPTGARLFFALWPDRESARHLRQQAEQCAQRLGGRPMAESTLHLTLAFLGEVAGERLATLHTLVERVETQPFRLRLDCLGFWPHNRIVWAGCKRMDPALEALATRLADVLREGGYSLEKRRFVPHLTLLRKVPSDPVELPAMMPVEWDCERFVLVGSELKPQGPGYREIAGWPLLH